MQGCVDISSFFDSGPSDEELFKNAGAKKVFPPSFTNVKDGATLIPSHKWEGNCGTDSTIEIKSKFIKGGAVQIPCKDRRFSQVLEWQGDVKDQKVEVSYLQTKGGAKSEEQKIFVTLNADNKTDNKKEIAKEKNKEEVKVAETAATATSTPLPTSTPSVVTTTSAPPQTPVVENKVEVKTPEVAAVTPQPTTQPLQPPPAVVETVKPIVEVKPSTQVSSLPEAKVDEKFITNTSSEVLIDLTGAIVINEVGAGGGKGFSGAKNMVDEQRIAGDPKQNKGNNGFKTFWSEAARLSEELNYQKSFLAGIFDLGKLYELTEVYIFGGNNVVSFYGGGPVKDWIQLGQVRLRPGVWNKVVFDKKMNSKYLKMNIDFLSSDVDEHYTASSGGEMVLYGKPFDDRAPAGIPQSKQILKAKSFDEIVGVNLFVSDPINSEWIYSPEVKGKFKQKNATDPVGVEMFSHARVKLYTPWFLTHFDHDAPNWLLRFHSINLENHKLDLDYYFQELNKQRSLVNNKAISVYASYEYTIPSLFPNKIKEQLSKNKAQSKDADGQFLYPWKMGKVKPLSAQDKVAGQTPKDFKDEAELYFQYAGRYGKDPTPLLEQHRKIASDQKAQNGLGMLSAIEAYPYPDRAKNSVCPECSFFHPLEYAAYLSALYDGDQKTLGPNFGVKSSSPSTPLIFGSMTIPTLDYPLMVSLWSKEYRSNQGLPFDVLAYTASSKSQGKAQHPEASGLYDTFKKLVFEKNKFFPDKELWITEFGFESDPTQSMGVQVSPGYTPEEVQGIWLTRGLLLLTAAGVDRIYLQPLFDNHHFSSSSYGLVHSAKEQYKTKKSYNIVAGLLKSMNEFVFDKFIDPLEDHKGNQDVVTLQFAHKSNPKKFLFISWTPTNNGSNHTLSKYQLPLENKDVKNFKVQMLKLSSEKVEVERSPASGDAQGNIIFDVYETPTLLEVEVP